MNFDVFGNITWCPANNLYFSINEEYVPQLITTRSSNGTIEIFSFEKFENETSILCEV